MKEILELIFCGLFLFGMVCLILGILYLVIIYPYVTYQLSRKSNKIQWRCQETYESRNNFLNGESDNHICDLSYRILPSEVNKLTRIYGNNHWNETFTNLKFKNKEEFQIFVKNFQTLNDIKTYVDKENGTLWYEPET